MEELTTEQLIEVYNIKEMYASEGRDSAESYVDYMRSSVFALLRDRYKLKSGFSMCRDIVNNVLNENFPPLPEEEGGFILGQVDLSSLELSWFDQT